MCDSPLVKVDVIYLYKHFLMDCHIVFKLWCILLACYDGLDVVPVSPSVECTLSVSVGLLVPLCS